MALIGQITKYNHPSYNISQKHVAAQEKLAEYLSHYFWKVFIEFDAPVPNPARVIGDINARSTKPYDLDVFAEAPIWEKLESVKYQRIGIEIIGPSRKGHNNKHQLDRDEARLKQIHDYYNIPIYSYSCHEVVGNGYKDARGKNHPCHRERDYFRWWGIVPKQITV